jgi:hypothetical protein
LTGEQDEEGNDLYHHPEAIKGKAGIIHYYDCDFNDASGHLDVWDGYQVKGSDYLRRCDKIALYNVCNPIANPSYEEMWKHMKDTNAWDKRSRPVVGRGAQASRNGRVAPDRFEGNVKKTQVLL